MKITQIYVTLPVKDIQKTKEFWRKLGLTLNEQFSDERAACVVMKEDNIYVMFLTEEYFQSFINKPVAKTDTTQVIVSIGLNSRDEVDNMVKITLENGASQHEEPQDYGWMYQNSFWDINGHGWNATFVDASKIPSA